MKSSEDSGAQGMGIGAVAARFGLATHVLRHWESKGLLHPERDAGGRRRYGADDLTRVAIILLAKEAGLGLDTIRSLATTVDRTTRRAILRPEAAELRARIAAAQSSLALIEGGLNCEHEDVTRCPNYQRLIAERVAPRVPVSGPASGPVCGPVCGPASRRDGSGPVPGRDDFGPVSRRDERGAAAGRGRSGAASGGAEPGAGPGPEPGSAVARTCGSGR